MQACMATRGERTNEEEGEKNVELHVEKCNRPSSLDLL